MIQSRKAQRSIRSHSHIDIYQGVYCVGLVCAVAAIFISSGCNQGVTGQDVMAKVNGSKILRSEVDKSYNSRYCWLAAETNSRGGRGATAADSSASG